MSGAHVVPRSVVFRIVPASPTMKPVPDPRRCAPFKLFVVPELTGDHWPNAPKPKKKTNHNVRSTLLPINETLLFVAPNFLKQLNLNLLNLEQPVVLPAQQVIEFLVQVPNLQLGFQIDLVIIFTA